MTTATVQSDELTSGSWKLCRRVTEVSSHSGHCDKKQSPRKQSCKVGCVVGGCTAVYEVQVSV